MVRVAIPPSSIKESGEDTMTKAKKVIVVLLLFHICRLVAPTYAQVKPEPNKTPPTANENTAETGAVTEWLIGHAMRLRNLEADPGAQDFGPLKRVLRNVRLVGLGEESHGAREIFQFKHRMIEFLVRELGFNILAMEVSYP